MLQTYRLVMGVITLLIPIQTIAALSFDLVKEKNGIDGYIEVSNADNSYSKLRLLDKSRNEIESHTLEGRNPRLDRIDGHWFNGPVFFITPDLSIGMGSYNGPYSQPFQIYQGHIHLAVLSVANEKKHEPIYLAKTLKTEWRAKKIGNAVLEILEVRCRPDFDLTAGAEDEMKFERTFTRYEFDGNQWQRWQRSEEGCWEAGEKFPDRGSFL